MTNWCIYDLCCSTWFFTHFVVISTVDRQGNELLRAEEGSDFIGVQNQEITFEAGERLQFYTINLADGVDVGKPEYFEVCLSSPMPGYIKAPACAMIYIEDDDCEYLCSKEK